jgi:hypothetical protein
MTKWLLCVESGSLRPKLFSLVPTRLEPNEARPERGRSIIDHRNHAKKLHGVGDDFGVVREHAPQLETRAKANQKEHLDVLARKIESSTDPARGDDRSGRRRSMSGGGAEERPIPEPTDGPVGRGTTTRISVDERIGSMAKNHAGSLATLLVAVLASLAIPVRLWVFERLLHLVRAAAPLLHVRSAPAVDALVTAFEDGPIDVLVTALLVFAGLRISLGALATISARGPKRALWRRWSLQRASRSKGDAC